MANAKALAAASESRRAWYHAELTRYAHHDFPSCRVLSSNQDRTRAVAWEALQEMEVVFDKTRSGEFGIFPPEDIYEISERLELCLQRSGQETSLRSF